MGRFEERIVIGELPHLIGGGLNDLLAAIADIDTPKTGHAIENAVAVAVPNIAPIALGNDPQFGVRQGSVIGERVPMMVEVHLLGDFDGGIVRRICHCAVRKASICPLIGGTVSIKQIR